VEARFATSHVVERVESLYRELIAQRGRAERHAG